MLVIRWAIAIFHSFRFPHSLSLAFRGSDSSMLWRIFKCDHDGRRHCRRWWVFMKNMKNQLAKKLKILFLGRFDIFQQSTHSLTLILRHITGAIVTIHGGRDGQMNEDKAAENDFAPQTNLWTRKQYRRALAIQVQLELDMDRKQKYCGEEIGFMN